MTTIVNFLTKNDDPKEDFYVAALTAHLIFCMFNVLNITYIVFFEGCVYGRLGKNTLTKLALVGCFAQMLSCMTSIHRYNIYDEYSDWGRLGTLFGLIAYFFVNVGYLYMWKRKCVLVIGTLFWLVVASYVGYKSEVNWDEEHFDTFRKFVGGSSLYQVIANVSGWIAHSRGAIKLDPSILSYQQMNRLFLVCIFLGLSGLVGTIVCGMPMVSYPASGATFSIFVIIGGYVGRMDFMTGDGVEGTEGETQPLSTGEPKYDALVV